MRRLAALALALSLFGSPVFAQISPAAPAPTFQKAIADTVAWINKMGQGKLVLGAPATITPKGSGESARLTGVVVRSPEGELKLGDIVIDKTELPGGLWRLSGSLPGAISLTGKAMPPTTMAIPHSSFEIDLDPRTGTVSASKLAAADLAVVVAGLGRVAIAETSLDSRAEPQPDGRASLPSSFRVSGISVRNDADKEVASIRGMRGTQKWDGVAANRVQDLQTFLFGSGGSEAELEKNLALLIKPDIIARGGTYRAEVEGVAVGDGAGGKLGALTSSGFDVTFSGLNTDRAMLSFGYRHAGLAVDLPFIIDRSTVPETLEFEIVVEPVPVTTLLALIGDPDVDAKGEAALKRAGTAFKLRRGMLKAGIVNATLEGEFRADEKATGSMTGRGALSIANLDKVLDAAGPMLEEYKAAVQLFATMGQKTTAADGQVTTRWEIEEDAAGRTLLNGNDISALIAQSSPGAAKSGTTRLTGESVSNALEELGYDVGISKSRTGEPRITAELSDELEGETMEVVLRDCKDGACQSLTFGATLTAKRAVPLTRVNDWNVKNRNTRASRLKEREVRLEQDLGGDDVLGDALVENIEAYIEILTTFASQVRGKQ